MLAVQAASGESAPDGSTLNADCLDLSAVSSITPVLVAGTGESFDGTGEMLAYVQTPAGWVRVPSADFDMTPASGLPSVVFPALTVSAHVNGSIRRFMWVPYTVGLSPGSDTNISTYYLCCTSDGIGL